MTLHSLNLRDNRLVSLPLEFGKLKQLRYLVGGKEGEDGGGGKTMGRKGESGVRELITIADFFINQR